MIYKAKRTHGKCLLHGRGQADFHHLVEAGLQIGNPVAVIPGLPVERTVGIFYVDIGAQQPAAVDNLDVPVFADPLSKSSLHNNASLRLASIL